MVEGSCHCGAVRVTVEAPPAFINECNCTLCSKLGAWWGYYPESEVSVDGSTSAYCRHDKLLPSIQVYFCTICGATTHWRLTPPAKARLKSDRMGVNMRLLPRQPLRDIEVRFPDGLAWTGTGDYGYVRDSEKLV